MTIREVQYSDDTMNHNLESYEVISSNDLCVSEILEYLQVELGPSLGSSLKYIRLKLKLNWTKY